MTTWQLLNNYYWIQRNTVLFTTPLSFTQAIILKRSVLLWARTRRRKPERAVLSLSSQLLTGSSHPARTKPSKGCRRGAADFNHIPFLEEESLILGSGGEQQFILPWQRPLPKAPCALHVVLPSPPQLLLCGTSPIRNFLTSLSKLQHGVF